MPRLPDIHSPRFRILVICEGYEEYEYMSRLRNLALWNKDYYIQLDNAEGIDNIIAKYQANFNKDSYDAILVFCDTDKPGKKQYKKYEALKENIDRFRDKKTSCNIIMYGNPCTLQIVLLHFENVKITSPNKSKNAPIIEEILGIKCYDAREDQRNKILSMVDSDNYETMKSRVKKLPHDDSRLCSSNFDVFMEYFENQNNSWIKKS